MRFSFLLFLFMTSSVFGSNAKDSKLARFEIDRIEILGASVLDQSAIENALEIEVGDALERVKIERSSNNLQNIYRSKGYEEVQISSEFVRVKASNRKSTNEVENVLRFRVKEGIPTRISEIKLIPRIKNSSENEVLHFQKYWKNIENHLLSLVGSVQGNILDQEKISAGKRAVLDFFASEEYVGAFVDDIRAIPANVQSKEKGKWIDLEIYIDLGDRVSFGFRGNSILSRGQLTTLVEDQRQAGFGKDYVNAIRVRIEDEYRSMGYNEAKVAFYTFENKNTQERHITYEISEGSRIGIEDIFFDGNIVFTGEVLLKNFTDLSSFLVQKKIYVEKEIEKSAERLIEWIKSQGYLSAKLVTISYITSPKKNAVHLVIYLYEGEQTIVQSIEMRGLKEFSLDEAYRVLGVKEGEPLNLFRFNEGLETLKSMYRERGYFGISFLNENKENVVKYFQENRFSNIFLEIDEGFKYKVNRIEIDGLTKTHEMVVKRELSFVEVAVLEESQLTESESRLRKLGIFSSVSIRLTEDDSKPGYKNIRIGLQEGTPGIIAGGVGYRNDLGIRVFGQSAYTNLWRRNHTLSFNVNVNRRFDHEFCRNTDNFGVAHGGDCYTEYHAELGYYWPWFVLGETIFRPKFFVENTQFLGFDAVTKSLSLGLERKLLKSINLVGGLSYSLEETEQENAQASIDNQKLLIGSITPTLRLDLRDNSLAPTSGLFSSASFDYASPSLLSQGDPFPIAFTRFQWRTDRYISFGKNIVFYLSFRTGFEKNLVQTPPEISQADELARRYAIPLSKQFALGGAGSLRGFGEQKLNHHDLAIRGTLSYVNYRTQLDFPFAGSLKFGPFLDAANLLIDKFSFGILRYGAGVGFHYLSPVGPINFDWGFNLFPQSGEDPFRFHFSIGVI